MNTSYHIPHEAFILTNSKNLEQFSVDKIIAPYEQWKNNNIQHPYELEIHLTNKCNLNCHYCSYKNRKSADELSFSEVKSVIDNIEQSNVKTLFFSGGGDPLTWKHWNNLIEYSDEVNCSIPMGIATNIVGLRKSIKSIERISFFQIHITAYDRESFLLETGVDRFEDMLKDLDYLFANRSSDSEVVFKILINKYNYKKIKKYIELIEKYNADSIIFKLEQDFENEKRERNIDIEYVAKEINETNIATLYKTRINNFENAQFKNSLSPKSCYIVSSNLYGLITPNGNFFPCIASTYDNSNSLGNIKETCLKSIISNDSKKLQNIDNMLNNECPVEACRHYRFNQVIEEYKSSGCKLAPKFKEAPHLI